MLSRKNGNNGTCYRVTPAKAGVQRVLNLSWIPAFAGMTIFVLFLIVCPRHAVSLDEQKTVLSYSQSHAVLNSAVSYLENNSIMRIISRPGQSEDEVVKNDFFQEMELRKEMDFALISDPALTGSEKYFTSKERADIVNEENSLGERIDLRSQTIEGSFDSTGRQQRKLNITELPFAMFPVIFSSEPVSQGDSWSNVQTVQMGDLIPMDLKVDYKLNKFFTLFGEKTAEIIFSVSSEFKSSDISEDPQVLQKAGILRSRGVEKISIVGTGRMAFSLTRNLPTAEILDFVVEITEKSVTHEKREVGERVREIHKAEAFFTL